MYLPRPLGGDSGEVEHDNTEIQCGIQIIGVGILLLHQIDAVILHKEAIGLTVEIAGGERSGVEGLPEHIVVEVHHLVKPRLVAPAPHVNQIVHALFGRVVLLFGPHIDLRHTSI